MMTFFIYSNTIIFSVLAEIHFYWAFGGKRGILNAVPSKDKMTETVFKPSVIATLFVAFGLLSMAFITFSNLRFISIIPPQYLGILK